MLIDDDLLVHTWSMIGSWLNLGCRIIEQPLTTTMDAVIGAWVYGHMSIMCFTGKANTPLERECGTRYKNISTHTRKGYP